MTAKVNKKPETSKFSTEKGMLTFENKCYCECNQDDKNRFNDALIQEKDSELLSMLERATLPLLHQFAPAMKSGILYNTKSHFV